MTLPNKRAVVSALKGMNKKYAKPFDDGKMASVSVFGGNWEGYAAVVLDMVTADTLLDIQEQLVQLNKTMQQLAQANVSR